MTTLSPELAKFVWSDKSILTLEEQAECQQRRKQLESELTPEKIQERERAWKKFAKITVNEENIQIMEETRKEINQCRLAFL
ncbi:MAG: hypothetical protein LBH59_04090 [Planctomycetaceae bacterium]|jgi:hypothetical protein|nr:hypothetical protein [Planctomycetaceae bacterium]